MNYLFSQVFTFNILSIQNMTLLLVILIVCLFNLKSLSGQWKSLHIQRRLTRCLLTPMRQTKWESVAHLKCNNRIRLSCCNILAALVVLAVAVVDVVVAPAVVVVVARYFGIYRVLTQSQFQLTLFAFGHCQCCSSCCPLSIAVWRQKFRLPREHTPHLSTLNPFQLHTCVCVCVESIAVCLMKNAFVCTYMMWTAQNTFISYCYALWFVWRNLLK